MNQIANFSIDKDTDPEYAREANDNLIDYYTDAISEDKLKELKSEAETPDAFGVVMPEGRGDETGETPITDISYIGKSTAEDMHPTGDVMSIEELEELSDIEKKVINSPIEEERDLGKDTSKSIISSTVEESDSPRDALKGLMNATEEQGIYTVNDNKQVSISNEKIKTNSINKVEEILSPKGKYGSTIIVDESGNTFGIADSELNPVKASADATGEKMEIGSLGDDDEQKSALMTEVGGGFVTSLTSNYGIVDDLDRDEYNVEYSAE